MPDYSELLDPKRLTIAETQKLLKPQEALLAIYSTQKRALVWAVPAQGQPAFHIAELPSAKVRAEALRQASLTVMQQSAKAACGASFSYAHPMFWAPFVVVGDGG